MISGGSTNNGDLRKLNYPLRVGYINSVNDWTDQGLLKGLAIPGYADSQNSDYNYIMLSFWFCGQGTMDMALYWEKFH